MCYTLQIKLHHIDVHSDASNSVIHDISRILKDTLFIVGFYNRAYSNNSNNATEISGNSVHNYSALWYQFSSILLEYIVPPSLGHSAHVIMRLFIISFDHIIQLNMLWSMCTQLLSSKK